MEINRNRIAFLAAVVLILLLGVYLRTGLLKFQGMFEPDGFFHYTIVEQTLANGLVVPEYSALSGFPQHNLIAEPLGLYYMSIIPYLLLGKTITPLQVMRLIPILFGLLDAIGAFFLVMYLFRSRMLGLLAMFMVAVSSGDIARTGALVYRGDGFITIFMIVSLILLAKAFRKERMRDVAIFGIASAAVIGIGTVVWAGAPFMSFVYMTATILVAAYAFVIADLGLLKKNMLLSAAIIVEYLIQHFWMYIGFIRAPEALSSLHFFLFYIPLLLGNAVLLLVLKRRDGFKMLTFSTLRRAESVLGIVIIGAVLILAIGGSYISNIASGGGLVIAGNTLTESIQELQPPTLSFIWGSFGFQLPLAILGVFLFLFASAELMPEGLLGSGKLRLKLSVPFLIILSYLLLTGYLQAHAIRFNSILAVPVALFAAYAVYALWKILEKRYGQPNLYSLLLVGVPVAAYMIISVLAILYGKLNLGVFIDILPALFVGIIFALIASVLKSGKGKLPMYIYVGILALILSYSAIFAYVQMLSSGQADGINPQFLSAMTWLRNNTPSNATVLAVWPDGSVVEGWANRQSSVDSVNGQNPVLIKGFANFIFNDTPDSQYLLNQTHRPEYLVARYYWMSEYGGLLLETGMNNTNGYSIYQFQGASLLNGSNVNRTEYYFVGSGSYNATLSIGKVGNTLSVNSSLVNRSIDVPLAHTILYNENLSYYQEYNYTASKPYNGTLFISYYVVNGRSQITGAYVMGEKLAESNFVKFLFLCGPTSCSYGNGSVKASLVYQNSDTRIFKLNYT